jgi:hypothetical protein
MLSPLRNRFGIPGVISVIALVFAMMGGAYAATNDGGSGSATASAKKKNKKGKQGGLNGKQKNQVRNISKQEARKFANSNPGAPGAPGPQGPAGLPGANGNDGQSGADGDDGGTGATGATGETGATGATGATGEDGSPWTAGGTLPSGETETGGWAFGTTAGEGLQFVAISWPIPLPASIPVSNTHYVETSTAECPGTAAAPAAEPGHLCVYQGSLTDAIAAPFGTIQKLSGPAENGADAFGARVALVAIAPEAQGNGTFAVTAP